MTLFLLLGWTQTYIVSCSCIPLLVGLISLIMTRSVRLHKQGARTHLHQPKFPFPAFTFCWTYFNCNKGRSTHVHGGMSDRVCMYADMRSKDPYLEERNGPQLRECKFCFLHPLLVGHISPWTKADLRYSAWSGLNWIIFCPAPAHWPDWIKMAIYSIKEMDVAWQSLYRLDIYIFITSMKHCGAVRKQ